MPGAPRWPHRIPLEDGRHMVEFPLPTIRVGPLNVPATGGAYLRLLPFWVQRRAVGDMLATRKPFILSVHPWELDPCQPRYRVKLRTRWTHYHNLDRAEARLTSLLSQGRFSTIADVLRRLDLLMAGVCSCADRGGHSGIDRRSSCAH